MIIIIGYYLILSGVVIESSKEGKSSNSDSIQIRIQYRKILVLNQIEF